MPKCILTEQGGKGGGGGAGLTLIKLEVTHPPTKQDYIAEEEFQPGGMIVTATYGVGETVIATGEVTGYQCTPKYVTDDTGVITVTYSEMGSTQTATTLIHVTHKVKSISVTTPPNTTEYQYNTAFNKTGIKVTAVYSDNAQQEKDENQITIVSPTEHEVFKTLGTQTIQISYTENTYTVTCEYKGVNVVRADNTINFDLESVNINTTDSVQLTVTRLGDGLISWDPQTIQGIDITGGGANNIITFKGDGATTVEGVTLTIKVAEGTYYKPIDKTIQVRAVYWEWGDQDGEADEQWFKGLASYLESHTGASLEAVGKTKKVTLSSPVLSTTSHYIRCIGADQDAEHTIAFQTKNCLNDYTTFSTDSWSSSNSTAARWTDSHCKAKQECDKYYKAFPGKAYILELERGTCPNISTGSSRNDAVTYNKEKVFLLSEREFGLNTYSPLSDANSSSEKAECTKGKNFFYSYYDNNNKRIMGKGDSSSSGTDGYPWERSRHYNVQGSVCGVGDDGAANHSTYDDSYGLAPAFVIGKQPQE